MEPLPRLTPILSSSLSSQTLPLLAITLGDVAGVGPEITAKMLLNHPELRKKARFIVIGDVASLKKAVKQIGLNEAQVQSIQSPDEATNQVDEIQVIQVGPSLEEVPLGKLHPLAGAGSALFVKKACGLARRKEIDGIVTAPLNKAAMHMGGYHWPGHTELLAHEFGVKDFSLVLSAKDLYVFHVTTHVSMRQCLDDITPARLDEIFSLIHAFSSALGRENEEIAVCGLNAHAGENNLFGTEESQIIQPAIERARQKGLLITDPLPADAAWPHVVKGRWKFLVCMYHDQGHAPFKAVYGEHGVNITVGLPVVRVSVDHGTAFDIVGQNIAREDSLILAAEKAAQLAPGWEGVWQSAVQQVGRKSTRQD